jgi:hypothetical protein
MIDPVACPHCGKELKALPHLLGQPVCCPACRATFTLAPAADVPKPRPVRPEPLPPDALTTTPGPGPAAVSGLPGYPGAHAEEVPPPLPRFRLRFQARVVRDPVRELSGIYDATLTDAGLRLQNDEQDVLLERGVPTRHEGDNRIVVRAGRDLELALARKGWAADRLAPDVAAFLNRELDRLNESAYRTPLYLCLLAFLPVGIPFVTGGGLVWGSLASVLILLCLALAAANSLSRGGRLLGLLVLTAFGYGTIFTFHPTLSWGRHEIDPSAWRPFAPAGAPFEVELPGEPRPVPAQAEGGRAFTVERPQEELTFSIAHHASEDLGQVAPQVLDLLEASLAVDSEGRKTRRLMVHGCPALEVEGHGTRESRSKQFWVRVVVVGATLVELRVVAPKRTRYETDVRRFLASFRPR